MNGTRIECVVGDINGIAENKDFMYGVNEILKVIEPPASIVPVKPKKVIFNDPATIVYWPDGTKTVVKCGEDDVYDKEKGLALCYMKKVFRDKGNYNEILKEWCKEEEPKKKVYGWVRSGSFLKCSNCGLEVIYPVKKCPKCESMMCCDE